MYFLIILVLRFSGKRGVRQLSIFEIAIILSLGSAAGDAMFYEEVPYHSCCHRFCSNYGFISLNNLFNDEIRCYLRSVLEGRPIYIVKNGLLIVEDIKQEKYSYDEFFAEMRQKKIEHLGQVKIALLETDGCLSVIPYSKENINGAFLCFPMNTKSQIITMSITFILVCCVVKPNV